MSLYEKEIMILEDRVKELEAENKRLRRAIEDLNPDYYMGISLCECSSEYPIGSCLYCDMQGLKEALARSNDTVVRSDVTKANQIAECGKDKSPICPIHGTEKMVDGVCHGTHVRDEPTDNNTSSEENVQVSCTCGEINGRHCQVHQEPTERNGGAE